MSSLLSRPFLFRRLLPTASESATQTQSMLTALSYLMGISQQEQVHFLFDQVSEVEQVQNALDEHLRPDITGVVLSFDPQRHFASILCRLIPNGKSLSLPFLATFMLCVAQSDDIEPAGSTIISKTRWTDVTSRRSLVMTNGEMSGDVSQCQFVSIRRGAICCGDATNIDTICVNGIMSGDIARVQSCFVMNDATVSGDVSCQYLFVVGSPQISGDISCTNLFTTDSTLTFPGAAQVFRLEGKSIWDEWIDTEHDNGDEDGNDAVAIVTDAEEKDEDGDTEMTEAEAVSHLFVAAGSKRSRVAMMDGRDDSEEEMRRKRRRVCNCEFVVEHGKSWKYRADSLVFVNCGQGKILWGLKCFRVEGSAILRDSRTRSQLDVCDAGNGILFVRVLR